MERIALTNAKIADAAARAADVCRAGGLVLYPTDTLYGLGADALSDEAVQKVIALKGRDEKKPIHAIVADIEMAGRYAVVPEAARKLIEHFGGQVTLVCRKKPHVASGIARDTPTFGFRVPDNEFCIALARSFDGPYTATSANRAGETPQRIVDTVLRQFGHSNILKNVRMIDLVVDAGELPAREPSTVVDLTKPTPTILRESAISAAEVAAALGKAGV